MTTPELALRDAVIATCRLLEREGLVVGTYGNVSVRVAAGLLVTPSRVAYAELRPEDLVTVDLEGRVVEGERLPSSETSVHRLIYVARPDVGAILHTHALHATALSCLGGPVATIVEEQAQVLGGAIPRSTYVPAGKHDALGKEVARALGASAAVLLANHGLVTCGRDLDEAFFATRIAERVATMHLLTAAAGGGVSIPDEHVESERDRYLHRYGTAADHEGGA